ncbi:MAG: tetratricopeptide repeat protein [Candidatus Saganbacteria bacterium]|nr:tetratricopeptide repeat protein [Candidatus Saganbacteria bacterium]
MKKFIVLLACFLGLSFLAEEVLAIAKINPNLKAEYLYYFDFAKKNPQDPLAHYNLSVTCAYIGKVEDAWNELKIVNRLDKNYAVKAISIFSKKVEQNPYDWEARFRLAFAYYFSEGINAQKKAYLELGEIAKMEPVEAKNAWAYGYMAVIDGKEENWEEAIKLSKKALEIEPEAAAINFALGHAYLKTGHSIKATYRILRALRLRWMEKVFGI